MRIHSVQAMRATLVVAMVVVTTPGIYNVRVQGEGHVIAGRLQKNPRSRSLSHRERDLAQRTSDTLNHAGLLYLAGLRCRGYIRSYQLIQL
jgi:hypothetical protein